MSATMERAAAFQTAKELRDEELRLAKPAATRFSYAVEPKASADLVVRAEVGLEEAKSTWNALLEFRDVILTDPACYDVIEGTKELNRTGATRLAVAFGLNIEERGVDEGRVELADSGEWDYRFRVRVRASKGARFVDGIGSCRISEISEKAGDLSRREHFALTKAWTRATKRAVADILGGTDAD